MTTIGSAGFMGGSARVTAAARAGLLAWGVASCGCTDAGSSSSGGGSGPTVDAGASSSSESAGTSGTSSSAADSSTAASTSSSTPASSLVAESSSSAAMSSSTSTAPFEQNRQDCVAHINQLRTSKGLTPYQRWQSAEECVDRQATHDQSVGTAHDAFNTGNPACGGNAQNECPGWGADAIVSCLDQMWAEGDQPGCAGCDACDTYTIFQGGCPDCTFFSPTMCGHYVNMTSTMFSNAACGFSTDGSWAAINFQ